MLGEVFNDISGALETGNGRPEDPQQELAEGLKAANMSCLTREPPWPTPAPEMFYGLFGDIVRKIGPHSEADPVGILVSLLAYFTAIIGRTPYFAIEATRHYLNLFVGLIGDTSSGRKGTASNYGDLLFKDVDAKFLTDNIVSGMSSGEGVINNVRDPIIKEVDGTQETVDEGVSDKRLLVREEELAQPFNAMNRRDNTLSAVLRLAWDGKPLRTLTRNNPLKATNAFISLLGHSSKEEFLKIVSATEVFNGLINRCLLFMVKRSKFLSRGGQLHTVDFLTDIQKLREAVFFARGTGEIGMDNDAWELWDTVYEELTPASPGLLGAATSRAAPQTRRLACLYALSERSSIVRLEHLRAALALWQYAYDSARYIFGDDKSGNYYAGDLLQAISDKPGITKTDLHKVPGYRKNAKDFEDALAFLVENGLIRSIQEPTNGRSVEKWYLGG